MKLNKKSAVIVESAIQSWRNTELIDPATATALQASIEVVPFDWRKLAKYSIWVALIWCFIVRYNTYADAATIF